MSPLAAEQPPQRPPLKAPLILLAVMLAAGAATMQWIHARALRGNPIFRQTKRGWQQVPAPAGFAERLRVSSSGAVWVRTWGRTAMSRWNGSAWEHYKETGSSPKTAYSDGDFALDGEQVWAPTEKGVLYWDGKRWWCYHEAPAGPGTSIVAGAGRVWMVDPAGKFSRFERGTWVNEKLALPGRNWQDIPEAGAPQLARTDDGTVWLVWAKIWRLDGVRWVPFPGAVPDRPLVDEYLIGTTGNRVWLSDDFGLRSISMEPSGNAVYSPEATGLNGPVIARDVASHGTLMWFASTDGLIQFDGSQWRRLPPFDEGVKIAHRISAAPDGTLWVIGLSSGGLFRNAWYLLVLLALLPLALIGASVWFFQRLRRQQLQQHQRAAQALQYATGEVPAELEIGERRLTSSVMVWILLVFGTAIAFILLRRFWQRAPYWLVPVIAIAIHLAITFQQSLVKRKPKPSDPIGPGAPPQYDWGKTLKAVAGGTFFLLVLNANRFPMIKFLRGYAVWACVAAWMGYKALGLRWMNQAARRGDYDAALKIIRWFHFYNPSGMEPLRLSGHILLLAGRYREAEDSLRRSLSSSRVAETYGLALEYLADTLMEQVRYDEAARCYQAALHSFPWVHRPYRGMTEMLLRQGKDNQQALVTVEKIIDFAGLSWVHRKANGRPQDDYWALKAWALARAGRSSEVAAAIENALKATDPKCLPDLAATHYRAGMAMQALGNMSQAKRHFVRAVEVDPHGRRGMLAKAAMREASVWGTVEV